MHLDERPETKYARQGDLHVAYQTIGDGPLDIVFIAPGVTSIETVWDVPEMAAYVRGLAATGATAGCPPCSPVGG